MIGRLRGTLVERGTDHVVIDVSGVGYVVHCSERTQAALPSPGTGVILHTDLLVREDLLQLYGFRSARERELHRMLMTVQGVGAKAALAIVAALGADGTIRAIVLQDAGSIRAAQGVGPKLAQRVVNELKEKAAGLMARGGAEPEHGDAVEVQENEEAATGPAEGLAGVEVAASSSEAISALENLGYRQGEAAHTVAEVHSANPEFETAELIREALKRLAKSK